MCTLRCCLRQTESLSGNASMSKMNGMEHGRRVQTPGTKQISIPGNCSFRIYMHNDPVLLPFPPDQLAVQVVLFAMTGHSGWEISPDPG